MTLVQFVVDGLAVVGALTLLLTLGFVLLVFRGRSIERQHDEGF